LTGRLLRGVTGHQQQEDTEMNILDKAKATANECARDIGGVWVVLGNPAHVQHFTEMRDVSITQETCVADFALPDDVILYRVGAA
jgi:hypothetical protein